MSDRIVLIVLDGIGIGELPDAAAYSDVGSNTLGNIFNLMGESFSLSNMSKLGLYELLDRKGSFLKGDIEGCYGKMVTKSPAKDTTAGHWEMAGLVLKTPFPIYPDGFPEEVIGEFEKRIGTKIIGNCSASGTEIIKQLGRKHQETGYPIVYTSADSVFQVAAHEETFGLSRLYKICKIARDILHGANAVGRVIARPFTGRDGNYKRTINRRDYSLSPFEDTVLDKIKNSGGEVIAVGKISDIFNGRGITRTVRAKDNSECMKVILNEVKRPFERQTLIFANFVDFDMLWGHRRNVLSYAKGLEDFDNFLPELVKSLKESDVLIITSDHGCDPTYKLHTDHTREYVPLLVYGKKLRKGINLGVRETLSDIAQTVSDVFGISAMENGISFRDSVF